MVIKKTSFFLCLMIFDSLWFKLLKCFVNSIEFEKIRIFVRFVYCSTIKLFEGVGFKGDVQTKSAQI